MANVMTGLDANHVDQAWDYHDRHLTQLDDKNFLSSARCVIYARPTNVGGESGTDSTFSKIGVIQGYNWSEQKQIEMIFELGSDVPYLIPGRTTGQISLSRILVAGADLTNLMYQSGEDFTDANGSPEIGTWLRSLRDVTIPLDLLVVYFDQASTANYSRLFSTCWIQARNESISSGQIIVAENVNIMYQNVTSYSTTAGTSGATPNTVLRG